MKTAAPQERAYWTHEVAEKLQVSHSTLKRWASELEMSGYKFTKGSNESRAFTAHDLSALERYKYLIKKQKTPKENAASIVTEEFSKEISDWAPPVQQESMNFFSSPQVAQIVQTLTDKLQQQEELNRQILQELHEVKEINQSISSQYLKLQQEISSLHETKQLLAASQEQKKGFWARLLNK